MPAQGALIRASDYNTVQALSTKSIARILGDRKTEYPDDSTRGTYGYGQTLLSSLVNVGDIADDLHLAKLKADLLKIATHCGLQTNPLITVLPNIAMGTTIDNADLEAFDAALQLLVDNRFELAIGQFSDESLKDGGGTSIDSVRTTSWGGNTYYGEQTVRHAFTIDFGSADNARYFFNAGGELRFAASRAGGVNSYQDQVWTTMLNAMGTIRFRHNITSANSGSGSSIGYYQLTNTPQTVFTKGAGGAYVYATQYLANDYTIVMSCNVADNTTGEARYLYVTVYFNDDHATVMPSNDIVTGTLTSNITIRRATGTNVEVSAPIATNTVLLTS